MFTQFSKVWDLQAQVIISCKINRVDDRMLCEVAFYGGLLGAKKKKIAYCRCEKFCRGTKSCLFLKKDL